MSFDVDVIVEMIYKFGALPIMIIVIWKLYKRNKELTDSIVKKNNEIINTISDKNDEIREIEKENIGLLYKCLAALRKVNKKNGSDDEE